LPKGPRRKRRATPPITSSRFQKFERERLEWRRAIHLLIDAAEDRGPMMFARMGLLRAFERLGP
jgi:hypothetical protein